MNLIEAFDERFAAWRGEADWSPWRVFLKALTAVPLDEDERPLFERCTGRTRELEAPASEAWCVVGRRGRKSAVAAMLAVHAAVNVDWSACVAPGETARILVVGCDIRQAKIVRSYCEAILDSVPEYEGLVEGTTSESVSLRGGLVIECVANNFRSIRGPAVVLAIAEESAFWFDERYANPDVEVLRAIRPSMLTTLAHGAMLVGLSSPYSKRGVLWQRFRDHHGVDDSKVLVWRADTATMNPDVDAEVIEEAYRDDPVAAAAEFGAGFRQDLESFLDPELLEKLVRSSPLELPHRSGIRYHAFCDPSGGRGDAMTLAIAHREKEGRLVLDLVRAVQPPFDPAVVAEDFSGVLKGYGLREVTGDRYSADWVVSAFADHGVTYRTSERVKSQIYLEFLPLCTQGRVELPDQRALLVELASLERRTARGGKDSVDHGRMGHDDLANAAAGALVLAETVVEQNVALSPVSVLKTDSVRSLF